MRPTIEALKSESGISYLLSRIYVAAPDLEEMTEALINWLPPGLRSSTGDDEELLITKAVRSAAEAYEAATDPYAKRMAFIVELMQVADELLTHRYVAILGSRAVGWEPFLESAQAFEARNQNRRFSIVDEGYPVVIPGWSAALALAARLVPLVDLHRVQSMILATRETPSDALAH